MAEEGKGKIKKFNGMNFQWWKLQVEDYLYQKDLYLPLVGEKPEAMNASEWAISDRKALATIRLSLTLQVAFNISKEKTTPAVMKALEKLYEKPSASNKVFLMKKLFNIRMSENGSVVDHLNDFNGVTNQLESVGINFDDEIRALLFLCSLHDSWNNLVTTVSNSIISGTLTLNDVVSSVMNDEMRRKTIVGAMAEEGKGNIEKFNGMNFQWWKMQVEDYLYQKDLYLPLVGEKPEAVNASEWAISDRKALATVRLSLTPQVAFNNSKEKNYCYCNESIVEIV
ncbi:hypothetical protein RJ640_013405 [Escallonia rubra]|uniref:Retrovirus-related Pol polyprotein from transposon TNT 1-94 n=1 Tax=Escallonia rubra TaxID=112253 RepID=A0AA88UU18_9ASTE|nr:hypothetical protein RJ640_013405 [Escallonia rubra]